MMDKWTIQKYLEQYFPSVPIGPYSYCLFAILLHLFILFFVMELCYGWDWGVLDTTEIKCSIYQWVSSQQWLPFISFYFCYWGMICYWGMTYKKSCTHLMYNLDEVEITILLYFKYCSSQFFPAWVLLLSNTDDSFSYVYSSKVYRRPLLSTRCYAKPRNKATGNYNATCNWCGSQEEAMSHPDEQSSVTALRGCSWTQRN